MSPALDPLFAHAGGFSWDEALLVMAPIALVAGLLFLANSRAKKLQGRDRDALDEPVDEPVEDEGGASRR
jgi:hypothetical protein